MEGTGSQLVLSQVEAFARIRLLRSPNIGPVSYRQLLARFGTAEAALENLPGLGSGRGKGVHPIARDVIEQEVDKVRRSGAAYLFHDQPDYPPLLRQLEGAPPILIYRGRKELASQRCVAIVGARNASAAGIKLASEFARELAENGCVIVSGLARGIDGAAHQSALPSTIGVIASGIDITYPPEHADLQQDVANDGLLLTEQPPGTEPIGRHFPSRNRIIAGLALGTVVIEAAPKSGSLITARLAGEAGREVLAVPGSPLDARAKGCNDLIRDGAMLVQSPDDVVELLEGFTGEPRSRFASEASAPEADEVLEPASDGDAVVVDDVTRLLSAAPIAVDELIRQADCSAADVHTALLELEVSGRLERHGGGLVSIVVS